MEPGDRTAAYLASFQRTWGPESPLSDVRFVVVDCETTGLDARKDRLVTIGAVAVRHGEIHLEDGFEQLLKMEYNTSAVTVHGVTRDESRRGVDEAEAIGRFLEYLKDGVVVGHHIRHDVDTLDAAAQRHFGLNLRNLAVDTMDVTLNLERAGGFPARVPLREFTLDALCSLFGILPHGRHTAAGDAFLTAQVFIRLLRVAGRQGWKTLGELSRPFVPDPLATG